MIKATGKRYIIEAEEQSKTTSGGILLQHSNDTQFAIIINHGPQVEEPLDVGTRCVVEWNHTIPLKDPETQKQYFLIESKCIVAVVEAV